jgi:hypothetical protein
MHKCEGYFLFNVTPRCFIDRKKRAVHIFTTPPEKRGCQTARCYGRFLFTFDVLQLTESHIGAVLIQEAMRLFWRCNKALYVSAVAFYCKQSLSARNK